MKIAFLNIYNGLVERGAETFVRELANRLAKKHDVAVYQAGDSKGDEGYKIFKVPLRLDFNFKDSSKSLKRRLFADYWSIKIFLFTLKALKDIKKKKYDIVIPVNGGWQAFLVRIVTLFYGGKMVVSGQSGIGWDDIVNLWCFPNTFVALSSYAMNWASNMNQFVKVKMIPNGVDLKVFGPEGNEFSHGLFRPVVLCAAALTENKRINLLIKAVEKLKGVSLLVCGKGELKSNIEEKGKTILGKRFKLVSYPFGKMAEVYRSCDIFSLPSESFQSFELVLVEAMACGKGVVANKDPIRKEIVGNAGILVDPKNSKEYAFSLMKALNTNWRDIPLKQAAKFNWDKITKQYGIIFRELIN